MPPDWTSWQHFLSTRTKMFIDTDTICIKSARFSFQRWTKDLKNLWNICEFCTLDKRKKMLRFKKKCFNGCFILSLISWYVCVFLYFQFSACLCLFHFEGFFLGGGGGGVGGWGVCLLEPREWLLVLAMIYVIKV